MTEFVLDDITRDRILDAVTADGSDELIAGNAVMLIVPLIAEYGDEALIACANALAMKIADDLGVVTSTQVHGPGLLAASLEIDGVRYTLDDAPYPLRFQLLAYEYVTAMFNGDRDRMIELSRYGNNRGASLFSGLAYTVRIHHRASIARNML